MKVLPQQLRLYAVTDRTWLNGRRLADVVAQAIAAGFTCVQIRSKECSARELISCTAQASEVIRQAGAQDRVALLIDDRRMRCMLLVSRE